MSQSKLTRRVFLGSAAALTTSSLVVTAAQRDDHALTPHQEEGPFFPIHEQLDKDADLTQVAGHANKASGEEIFVSGRILDEEGKPVEGALIDVWQANSHGRYDHEGDSSKAPLDPDFQGWAKLVSGDDGSYSIKTIKPAPYAARGEWFRPPHIHFKVARRGYNELITQMYFAGEALNDKDRLLNVVPKEQQGGLIVDFDEGVGKFDIILASV